MRQGGGQAILVIIKFAIELVKRSTAQIRILSMQKREISALGERDFLPLFID
jgi:hypothetical protein